MKKKRLWGLLAVLGSLLMFAALMATTLITQNGTADVLVAARTVAKGAVITAGDFTRVSMQKQGLPGNVITGKEALAGKYAAVDMVPGDLALQSKVSATPVVGDAQLSSLPSGKLAVSCAIPSQSAGLANKLQTGDIIRVYQYKDGAVTQPPELTYVKVLAVTDGNGKAVDVKTENVAATVTVLASAKQVKAITKLDHEGGVHLALVSRGDQALAEQLLGEQENNLRGQNA